MGASLLSLGGCASLDAQPEMLRSADAMERAVGMPGHLILRDEATAEIATRELLDKGLSAEQAAQVALLNNPRVRGAMLSIGVSRADFVQSTLYSNPALFLSVLLPDGGGRPYVEVNLAQNIAELWLVPARTKVAQRDLDQVVLEAARVTANVVLDVRRAYVRAVQSDAQIELASDGLDIATKLVEIAALRQQAGSGSEVDLNLARATKLQAETNLRNAKLAAAEAKAELSRLLGLSDDPRQMVLTGSTRECSTWNVSAEQLQKFARAARLDLQIVDRSVESAEARTRLERVRFLRSLEIGFSFQLAESRSRGDRDWLAETLFDSLQSGAPTPPNLMPRATEGPNAIAGPTLSLELPVWDQNQAQIAKADRLLEQARQERDAMLVDAAQDIHIGLARVRTASENARFYRDEFVPTAKRNVSLAQDGYRIGRVSFLSLLEAQRAYITTRTNQLDALRDAALAEIDLERVTGRPVAALLDRSKPNENQNPAVPSDAVEIAP
ncbi:MAG TPA: TolC family protein [Phycisphaerae bacterium]|nr:TolC family protein [Phycisphaerae bacterium]